MEIFATIVMLAWIPVVMLLFALLPAQRAVIVSFLGAWLFLPVVSYHLPFLPDYTKMSATCVGIFAGALVFDPKLILQFRFRWIDLPMVVYCLSPIVSSLLNGLGAYDGVSSSLHHVFMWGLPYTIGRCYFTTAESHYELGKSMLIGGLLYVPFCLVESRMSPIFHNFLYGFTPRGVQMRFGGWRPSVFMDSGLTVGMWMTAASLISVWLWWQGKLKSVWGIPSVYLVCTLLLGTILCRSLGSLVLLAAGLGVLWACKNMKSCAALYCLIALAPTYAAVRTSGIWNGEEIVSLAKIVSESRASSFQFRIKNENLLLEKALQKPAFGWGGWGRSRVVDEFQGDVSVTDGRWIIVMGAHGLVGMSSMFGMLLLPPLVLASQFSARRLLSAELAPTLAMAVMVSLYAIDCIPNAMANPLFVLVGGAVAGICVTRNRAPKTALAAESANIKTSRFAAGVPTRRPYPHPSNA